MVTADPDQFLDPKSVPSPVNTSGSWNTILQGAKLVSGSVTDLEKDRSDHEDIDVSIDTTNFWTGIDEKKRTPNWALKFSSERNTKYFGGKLSPDSRRNNAWIGDAYGSGVMLLQPGQPGPLAIKADLCAAFDIDLGASTTLRAFLDAIDGTGALKAMPVAAPDWNVDSTSKKKDPSLGLDRTITDGGPTNALWCTTTDEAYYTTVRVSYALVGDQAVNNVLSWIAARFNGLSPKTVSKAIPTVTLTKQTRYLPSSLVKVSEETIMSFAFDIMGFHLTLNISKDSRSLSLVPVGDRTVFSIISEVFGSDINLEVDILPGGSGPNPFATIFDSVHLWYLQIEDDTSQPSKQRLQWNLGLLSIWKPHGKDVVVALTYDSKTKTFFGRLLFESDLPDSTDIRIPQWDPSLSPNSILKDVQIGSSLDLWELLGLDVKSQPPIPSLLASAEVSFARTDDGSRFDFSASLQSRSPQSEGDGSTSGQGAPVGFSWTGAMVDVSIESLKDTSKPKTYTLDVYTDFRLDPPAGTPQAAISPASFALGLHYGNTGASSDWILRASAQNLSVGLLRSFFDSDAAEGAMAVMSKLTLRSLDMIYTYSGSTPSSFIITGVLVLGELELDLTYQYVSALLGSDAPTATQQYLDDIKSTKAAEKTRDNENTDADKNEDKDTDSDKGNGKLPLNNQDQFTKGNKQIQTKFIAQLRASSPGSSIASIAESIVEGAGDQLPEWVGGIMVNPVGTYGPAAELQFATNKRTEGNTSVLTFWLSIAGFTLTFVQYQTTSKQAGASNTSKSGSGVKRMLRISVDQIPMMDHIPLVGQLPQPFDHLEYVWVQDDNVSADASLRGITRSELGIIAQQFPSDIPPIQVKENKKPSDNDIVLLAGSHFIVVVSGQVVLDHVFNADKSSTKPLDWTTKDRTTSAATSAITPTKSTTVAPAPTSATTPSEAPPTKGNTKASAGPLSISALTFQYKNNSLFVTLDATLTLGPLTFSVIGFTIEILLSEVKLNHLADIVNKGLVHVGLHGIEVGVQQGPLTLKGVFIHDDADGSESYTGGIAVGFKAWQVLAVGQYTIKQNKADKNAYRAVFVYGKLDGPLVELEFATISGVRLGFGYNYAVRMPQLDQLSIFPFISDSAASSSGNDPMKVLDKMVLNEPYFVYPKEGAGWFCAGMTITAFDVLSLTAVLMVEIESGQADANSNGITIAMFADGVFQMEPLVTPDLSLFYIEIIVGVELNFVAGYIAANATLAPASHVYVPQARLSGQASFYTWFGRNAHAGDWVVTVGGYARAYHPPLHYPQSVDRMSLNFTVGDNIQIIGTAYLAVTPKCAMAGGTLHLSLSVGPVSAYADVILDAFINFKPFHFRAEISLAVGVECDIDILFIHIHVSIHLSADLVLWGPNDFGGHAHVDFWFFGFDIGFGADENAQAKEAISLHDFYDMVRSPGPNSAAIPTEDHIGNSNTTAVAQHKYSIEAGLLPASIPAAKEGANFPSTGATSSWDVQAGTLQIRIDCDFALSKASLIVPNSDVKQDPVPQPILLSQKAASGLTKQPATTLEQRAAATPTVYSWPMHSQAKNPVTSSLEVRIYQINDPNNHILQGGFQAELVLKSAASALWSVWDSTKDPLQTKHPDALLNAADGTTNLVQAVRLTAPPPHLGPSPIQQMDATAAMRETISGGPFKGGSWQLPARESQGTLFSGQYFEPDPKDDDVSAQVQRWEDAKRLWIPPPLPDDAAAASPDALLVANVPTIRASLVSRIAWVLEWTVRPPSQMAGNDPSNTAAALDPSGQAPANGPRANADGRPDWKLLNDPPARLVGGMDVFYPALPFVRAMSTGELVDASNV